MTSYVLVTPAHNEAEFIERTILSVVHQTHRPIKWVVVSDRSTDTTEQIVARYAREYPFIKLLCKQGQSNRSFAAKVDAFNMGYRYLAGLKYDFIGNLDADIAFGVNYYHKILQAFAANTKLGIAGGVRKDLRDGDFVQMKRAENSVAGAVQLFRRDCFHDIGGYRAMPNGGIDAVAETMARMYGWQVQSFPDIEVFHYRQTGSATRHPLATKFKSGIKDYSLGYHPLFESLRTIRDFRNRPYVIGGIAWLAGYVWAQLRAEPRQVNQQFVSFIQEEQLQRLRQGDLRGRSATVASTLDSKVHQPLKSKEPVHIENRSSNTTNRGKTAI